MKRIILMCLVCSGCCVPGRRVEIVVQASAPFHSVRCSAYWEDAGK